MKENIEKSIEKSIHNNAKAVTSFMREYPKAEFNFYATVSPSRQIELWLKMDNATLDEFKDAVTKHVAVLDRAPDRLFVSESASPDFYAWWDYEPEVFGCPFQFAIIAFSSSGCKVNSRAVALDPDAIGNKVKEIIRYELDKDCLDSFNELNNLIPKEDSDEKK